ncbi:hypothetical protein BC832DRAFT_550695 [Gaertneriomyces semiglobifer]|nr:hypothetical protein BC832DRAFT_550695 [Gaertneriomyces semiglobifer]
MRSTSVYLPAFLAALSCVYAAPAPRPEVAFGGLPSRHLFDRQGGPTCDLSFGTIAGDNTFGSNLFVPGDAWLQGFVVPATNNGTLCGLSLAVRPLFGATATATLSLFGSDTPQNEVAQSNAIPIAEATAT